MFLLKVCRKTSLETENPALTAGIDFSRCEIQFGAGGFSKDILYITRYSISYKYSGGTHPHLILIYY